MKRSPSGWHRDRSRHVPGCNMPFQRDHVILAGSHTPNAATKDQDGPTRGNSVLIFHNSKLFVQYMVEECRCDQECKEQVSEHRVFIFQSSSKMNPCSNVVILSVNISRVLRRTYPNDPKNQVANKIESAGTPELHVGKHDPIKNYASPTTIFRTQQRGRYRPALAHDVTLYHDISPTHSNATRFTCNPCFHLRWMMCNRVPAYLEYVIRTMEYSSTGASLRAKSKNTRIKSPAQWRMERGSAGDRVDLLLDCVNEYKL